MGTATKIEWCDHTFNAWRGCEEAGPGCDHCYARELSKRNPKVLGEWGPEGSRVVASEAYWKLPLKWDEQAKRDGVRRRVFCLSLGDFFEDWSGPVRMPSGLYAHHGKAWGEKDGFVGRDVAIGKSLVRLSDVRARVFGLARATPWLDWMFLTKRPENIWPMWPLVPDSAPTGEYSEEFFQNIWLGTSVATQADADRNIPLLLKCRELSPVLFVSAEPLLERVDLSPWLTRLQWVIIGGESGPNARPCDIGWIHSLVRQCKASGVPAFVKQLGAHVVCRNDEVSDWFDQCGHLDLDSVERFQGAVGRVRGFRNPKGGDPAEWPEDLRVREFPTAKEPG